MFFELDRQVVATGSASAVVRYAAGDDGEWVSVGSGTYDCSYINAMGIFMEQPNYCF